LWKEAITATQKRWKDKLCTGHPVVSATTEMLECANASILKQWRCHYYSCTKPAEALTQILTHWLCRSVCGMGPSTSGQTQNSVHWNLHIMMWKKNSCLGLSRGGKAWRQRQSTEWHHHSFHRINIPLVVQMTATMFSVSRIHFGGCDAERTGNKHIYSTLTKLPKFPLSSSSMICSRSPGLHMTQHIHR
jgi:hypothetical protein